jgi:hypothetical protein
MVYQVFITMLMSPGAIVKIFELVKFSLTHPFGPKSTWPAPSTGLNQTFAAIGMLLFIVTLEKIGSFFY